MLKCGCGNEYHYDRIRLAKTQQEKLDAKTDADAAPSDHFRDLVDKLEYVRLSGESSYVVARSVLIEHHARNERVQ